MKTLKICLVILCLLPVRAVGLPRFNGANFFMKIIEIKSPKYGHHNVILDDEDYDLVIDYKWCVMKDGNTFYAMTKIELKRCNGKRVRKYIKMHRMILGVTDKTKVVDHADRNGLNNQRNNIRVCNQMQNSWNQRKRVGASSKYIGVCWSKHRRKWMAFLQIGGITNNIGFYSDEIEAAKARDTKSLELHGEFANLNFPI